MLRKAMPHQTAFLKKSEAMDNIALFWEMRLGKTLAAIRWGKRFPGPRLVVAPLTVLLTWKRELDLEDQTSMLIHGPKKWDRFEDDKSAPDWYLVNYEVFSGRYPEKLTSGSENQGWGVVILDESTRIKNPRAKCSKEIVNVLSPWAQHRAILTGLPNPESSLDFFQQAKFLFGSFLGYEDYWKFRNSKFTPSGNSKQFGKGKRMVAWGWEPKPITLVQISDWMESSNIFVLTRKNVGLNNRKMTSRRELEVHKDCRELYRKVEEEWSTGLDDLKYAVQVHTHLCSISGGRDANGEYVWDHKIKELLYLLDNDLADQQVVVWFQRIAEGKWVEEYLTEKGHGVRRISGSVSKEKRHDFIKEFHLSGVQGGRGVKVLCIQQKIGMYGLDLSCASTAVYYSLAASLEQHRQSMDRLIHPQKRGPLLYVYLQMRDSVDGDTLDLLALKKFMSQSVLLTQLKNRARKRHSEVS